MEDVMASSKLAAALVAVGLVLAGTPVFAQRTSLYPEGSIFLQQTQPSTTLAKPAVAAERPQTAKISPLDPLDAPDAGNVWKPSNRDAGNLAEQRYEHYQQQLDAQRNAQ